MPLFTALVCHHSGTFASSISSRLAVIYRGRQASNTSTLQRDLPTAHCPHVLLTTAIFDGITIDTERSTFRVPHVAIASRYAWLRNSTERVL